MQCLVFNTKFDYSSYEKIGLDVVNLDFIFHVKCDHFSICFQKSCFICFNESPLKMMENAFYFILKVLSVLKIFKYLSWPFGHVQKTTQ